LPHLFGTDGIRGTANVDLKPTLAYALGRATAHHLADPGRPIVIGQDTRRSGDMFTAALVAGVTSMGVDVHLVGVVPTPALAYITGAGKFAAGIMVSASHNPAQRTIPLKTTASRFSTSAASSSSRTSRKSLSS